MENDRHDIPLQIGCIKFDGIHRTDQQFLKNIFRPVLEVKSMDDLKQTLSGVMQRVNRLQIFKESSISLEENQQSPSSGLTLIFKGEEKKYRVKIGTEVQKNDVAFNFGGFWANIFGRGEMLEASASYGVSTSAPLTVSFQKPIFGDPDRIIEFSVRNFATNRTSWQPFKSRLYQSSVSYSFPTHLGIHNVKAAVDHRSLYDFMELASPSLRKQDGTSVKTCISHVITSDNRNDRVLPSKGSFFRHYIEAANIYGAVSYLKEELFSQYLTPIYKDISIGISGHFGSIQPISSTNHSAILSMDRFHMGGPNSIRGFQANSLGPKDKEDSLGGRFIAEGAMHVSFPLSEFSAKVVRGHFFVNSGMLSERFFTSITNNLYTSVGCGLLANFGGARLELNACLPCSQPHNNPLPKPSLQLGIGVDFL